MLGSALKLNDKAYTINGVLGDDYGGNYGSTQEVVVLYSNALYLRLFERDSATMSYTGRWR